MEYRDIWYGKWPNLKEYKKEINYYAIGAKGWTTCTLFGAFWFAVGVGIIGFSGEIMECGVFEWLRIGE